MIGLVFKDGELRLDRGLPEPVPAEGEMLIRIGLAGICATDLEISKGYMDFEGVLGHEFVGRVEAPHDACWHGAQVVGGINCPCGQCDLCAQGMERHCPHRSVLGILGRAGAFAEWITLPRSNLVRVPPGISMEDAVYAEPLAAALRVPEQVGIQPGERVAVMGDGRLGLLCAGVGVALGWQVDLIGKHPGKMERIPGLAHALFPHEASRASYPVVVECTGDAESLEKAISLLRPRGKLVLKTTVAAGRTLDLNPLVINEIEVIGSRCGDLNQAVQFLEASAFRPSVLTTARYSLSKGEDAFRAAKDSSQIKVLLEMDGEKQVP